MVVIFLLDQLNSVYVGIDVSKLSNQVFITDFNQSLSKSFSAPNNNHGAELIETNILHFLENTQFTYIIAVLESTGIYSAHIATYLSASEKLFPYHIEVYCINPKISKNYRASFADMDKTDPKDAFILSDLARVGRTNSMTPFKGSQKLALQRLTRHRVHLVELLTKEKNYVLTNIFLKFSEFGNKDSKFTSNIWSKTAIAILEEYSSPEDIINTPFKDLVAFIMKTSKNRFDNSNEVAELIKKAANASYRLDKAAYKPINHAISSSLVVVHCYEDEIKKIDKSIDLLMKGFSHHEYLSLC